MADPDVSLRFYQQMFGVKEYYRDADNIQVLGPGPHVYVADPDGYAIEIWYE